MTLLAALQEDAKRLLAYSSVGQIGYVVVGLAMLTPLGWSAALYHTVNHLLVKMLLFLAIAGVIHRTGTTPDASHGRTHQEDARAVHLGPDRHHRALRRAAALRLREQVAGLLGARREGSGTSSPD